MTAHPPRPITGLPGRIAPPLIRGLSFSFGGQTGTNVGFDDITIWASECPTPVEPSTWGRMKAAYRSP